MHVAITFETKPIQKGSHLINLLDLPRSKEGMEKKKVQ